MRVVAMDGTRGRERVEGWREVGGMRRESLPRWTQVFRAAREGLIRWHMWRRQNRTEANAPVAKER